MAERTFAVRLSARVDAYVAAINRAKVETANFTRATERNMARTGKQMQTLGRNMTRYVSLPLAAVGVGAAAAAIKWESSWAGVMKTVNGTQAEMEMLEGQLRDLTRVLPASHTEIAGVAEAAGQLGIAVDDIAEFTEVMINLGVTTNLTANDAATALARVANIMGTTSADYERLGSTIVDLGNNSATTEAEIVELGTRIAAAGKVAGLSEADIFAYASTVTSIGVKAEAGGTALSKVFLRIRDAAIDGGEALRLISSVAGVSAEEFRQAFEEDAASAVNLWITGIGDMERAGQSTTTVFEDLGMADHRLMTAIRGTAASSGLLTDQLDLARNAWDQNLALQTEADRRYATTAAQFGLLRNKAVDLGITLGDSLLPVLKAIMAGAGSMIDAFAAMPAGMQATIASFGALVAVAGPTLMVLGSLIRNFQTLKSTLTALNLVGASVMLGSLAAAIGVVGLAWYLTNKRNEEAAARMNRVREAAADLKRELSSGADPIEVLSNQLVQLSENSPLLVESLNEMGMTYQDLARGVAEGRVEETIWRVAEGAERLGKGKDDVNALKDSLREWASVGKSAITLSEGIERADERVAAGREIVGEATEEATEAEKAHADAVEAASERIAEAEEIRAAALETIREQTERVVDAIRDEIAALNDRITAYTDQADAIFNLHDAEDAHIAAVKELGEEIEEGEDAMRVMQQRYDSVAETAARVAAVTLEVAEETAAMEGASLGATEKLDIQNRSLLDQAAALNGPARDAILAYIGRINGIPPEMVSHLSTVLNQYSVDEAESALKLLSDPRRMALTVDAKTDDAAWRLAQLERPLYTNVYVGVRKTGTLSANSFMDRGGYGTKGSIVAERRPEFVDGTLITGPSMLTEAAPVTKGMTTETMLRQFLKSADAQHMSSASATVSGAIQYVTNVDVHVAASPVTDKVALGNELVSVINEAVRSGGSRLVSAR